MKPIAYLTLNKIDYPILKVKEGYIAVDENAEIKDGDYRFNGVHVVIHNPDMSTKGSVKIIASTFPLEGVERFEMPIPKVNFHRLANEEWNKQIELKNAVDDGYVPATFIFGLEAGYKASQSKGTFIKEQARLIFNEGFAIGNSQIEESEGSEHFYDSDFERIIQSLLPRYEVEMEEYKHNSCVNKCASYPSECLCKMEGIKPLTYEKDGVTYLKLKH
jgi:hypothetical protein